jgi:hypothetical protein
MSVPNCPERPHAKGESGRGGDRAGGVLLARGAGAGADGDARFLKGVIERDRGDAAKGKADMDAALAEAPHVARDWAAFGVS